MRRPVKARPASANAPISRTLAVMAALAVAPSVATTGTSPSAARAVKSVERPVAAEKVPDAPLAGQDGTGGWP
ncbi:MAG: hypothetical protein FJZ00_10990 [Candidatus Sericytochromatia bacterium]|uniref:Uncharacterized protein n=1 Tax=Candidatus Tanganyikabacteria bacterium TaxID=2961651 RepID=A0A937X7P4_9BACT|nr:hypothetical protein [Candidatus Tanganyikabacteria bacterium]